MAIPYGYHINPITGTDWEGVGVPPDVKIEAEQSLIEAHRLALVGIRETLDRDWPRELLEEYIAEIDKELKKLVTSDTQ